MNLKTESAAKAENGKKNVLAGFASKKIVVEPPSTVFDLEIEGEKVQTLYKTDLDTAKQGLKFDISATQPPP